VQHRRTIPFQHLDTRLEAIGVRQPRRQRLLREFVASVRQRRNARPPSSISSAGKPRSSTTHDDGMRANVSAAPVAVCGAKSLAAP
jgi:hypothetical protein